MGNLSIIFDLALLIPGIAITTRRLHDTNRSGWWQLLAFIPIIGWIVLIVFSVQDTTPADNEYGKNPRTSSEVPSPVPTSPTSIPTPPLPPTATPTVSADTSVIPPTPTA